MKLTDKELEGLKMLERWCYDTMNHARISPKILSILIENYEAMKRIERNK